MSGLGPSLPAARPLLEAAAALERRAGSIRTQARKLRSPFLPINEVRKKWMDTPSSFWRQR